MKKISGKIRLSIMLSVIWLTIVVTFSFIELRHGELIGFIVFLGTGPLIVLWGIYWVIKGFKNDKEINETEINKRNLSDRDKKIIDSLLLIMFKGSDKHKDLNTAQKIDTIYKENRELCDNVELYYGTSRRILIEKIKIN